MPEWSESTERRSGDLNKKVMIGMGGALLITTPLAIATVRRWVAWWRD